MELRELLKRRYHAEMQTVTVLSDDGEGRVAVGMKVLPMYRVFKYPLVTKDRFQVFHGITRQAMGYLIKHVLTSITIKDIIYIVMDEKGINYVPNDNKNRKGTIGGEINRT